MLKSKPEKQKSGQGDYVLIFIGVCFLPETQRFINENQVSLHEGQVYDLTYFFL